MARIGPVKGAIIRQIAKQNRCSIAVAAHIYACKSIREKQRLGRIEAGRQLAEKTRGN